ncbi:MAG: hypothetical protein ONB24_01890 [candidate division KSB1 bacterium]|nr:hypothetical protein [candidate division KSB1 bacterium]
MATNTVCPYVVRHQSWLIKNVLSNYFKSIEVFSSLYQEIAEGCQINFARLKKLSDLLFRVKEDLHLIYKRISDPQKREYEKALKCLPNETEQAFINHVGLMFHKVMVARELQYMIEYYGADQDENIKELEKSLREYFERIHNLIAKGSSLLADFIALFSQDVVVCSFLYESFKNVQSAPLQQMTSQMNGYLGENWFRIAEYYAESGWYPKAKAVLEELLSSNPDHEKGKALMAAVSKLQEESVDL